MHLGAHFIELTFGRDAFSTENLFRRTKMEVGCQNSNIMIQQHIESRIEFIDIYSFNHPDYVFFLLFLQFHICNSFCTHAVTMSVSAFVDRKLVLFKQWQIVWKTYNHIVSIGIMRFCEFIAKFSISTFMFICLGGNFRNHLEVRFYRICIVYSYMLVRERVRVWHYI